MLEELSNNNSHKRKYRCCYDYEYDHYTICEFISSLGKDPEKYEIITVFRTESGRYEVFYKEYIDD